jgi:RimJ/RimL family protein N-acetyltransferase
MTTRVCKSVSIRPTRVEDSGAIQQLGSDAHVAATCGIEHPLPQGSGQAYTLRATAARECGAWFSYTVLVEGCIAGIVALDGICHRSRSANLFYWLGRAYWGRGIATQAGRDALHAARSLGLLRLEATTLAENEASQRVLHKLGFHPEDPAVVCGVDAGKFFGRTVRRFRTELVE